ncbi:MAG TPA: MazG nucleotide pyrophosphohydrolase domain-containing protein [Nevskiales bacterium]|nr:MazG nucleotide pyrophosphohydrolase domain-containing protein [Nevskiales bacterium]
MTVSSFRRALDLQAQAAAVGFDWPAAEDMLDKLAEELGELRAALRDRPGSLEVAEELGDILFVLVNLARRLQLAPEAVLAAACDKFERRFAYVCDVLAQRGLPPEQADLHTMEALWQQAKALERDRADLPAPQGRNNV